MALLTKRAGWAEVAWIGALLAIPGAAGLELAEMRALEAQLPPPAEARIEFDRDIRPILEASCVRCHGAERPKGKFRLTTRADALLGGSSGVAIVPGESESSPLIYYVARLVEDMEMPPGGKDEPLTAEQVGLLRAWIDQGAKWSAEKIDYPVLTMFSITPEVRWFRVTGDERQFQAHTGMKEGWNGGVQNFRWREEISERQRMTAAGHLFGNPEEYQLEILLEQRDFGFARFGAEQFREYDDDTGGFAGSFAGPGFSLDRDLYLDVGRAWAEFGLALPDRPSVTLGYEFRYRDGTRASLHWGDAGRISPEVNPAASDAKKVYPGSATVDERVHVVKLDAAHEVNGVGMENLFRAEWYENETSRREALFHDTGTGQTEKALETREEHEHWQIADSFRLEKQLLDWMFLSGGYLYSRLEGEYALSAQPVYPTGLVRVPAEYWFTDSIVLEQDAHVLNGNVQLGPWAGTMVYGGAQSEWMRQRGMGQVEIEIGDPLNGFLGLPARVGSDLERTVIEERVGVRYKGLPRTVLFGELRAAQENIGQGEELEGRIYPMLRETDAASDLGEARAGFTISPWSRVSLTGRYQYREKESRYAHLVDEASGFPLLGYSAFITGRETLTHEFSLKLTVRPARWLTTSLQYQQLKADYNTRTEAEAFISPGGSLLAGEHEGQVYSAHAGIRPWRRVKISASLVARRSRTVTARDLGAVLRPYEGTLYSGGSSVSYAWNEKTDVSAGYTYSRADYAEEPGAEVPVGLAYDWHIVNAGLTRRMTTNITARLQYRFYQYDEKNSGGVNNYIAHGVMLSMAVALP